LLACGASAWGEAGDEPLFFFALVAEGESVSGGSRGGIGRHGWDRELSLKDA
jgi:hypothetical protein